MYVLGNIHWTDKIACKSKNSETKLESGETQSDRRALLQQNYMQLKWEIETGWKIGRKAFLEGAGG